MSAHDKYKKHFDNYIDAMKYYKDLEAVSDKLGNVARYMKDPSVNRESVDYEVGFRDAYSYGFTEPKREEVRKSFGLLTDSTETLAPFDGKTYTSKAKMRAEANARGLIEIGNENVDKIQGKRREEIQQEIRRDAREDIKRALHMIGQA